MEMNGTVVLVASTGTWIRVCFSFFFFRTSARKTSLKIEYFWVKIKWHRCCLVDNWPVACSKTPGCFCLVRWFFKVFSWSVFGKCSLYAGGANSSVNTAGFDWSCWMLQNLKNMFCILDNDAVVVQKWPTKVLGFFCCMFFILRTTTYLVLNLRCEHADWNKAHQPLELCSSRAAFWYCAVQRWNNHPSKSAFFVCVLCDVTLPVFSRGEVLCDWHKEGDLAGVYFCL